MLGIITPVKNEAENLLRTFNMLINQTFLPRIWVIIDDCSEDDTPIVIKKLEKEYDFIIGLSISERSDYNEVTRYGQVVQKGVDYILSSFPDLELIGILDADIKLKNDYYATLVDAFIKNPDLGIASGRYLALRDGVACQASTTVCGAAMVFRKDCLLSIGGFPKTPCPDTVALLKAVNRGWLIGIAYSTYAIHLREKTSANNYMKRGFGMYQLGYHFFNALLSGPFLAFKKLSFSPLGFTVGYIKGAICTNKITDKEITRYFHQSFQRAIYKTINRLLYRKNISIDIVGDSIIKL